MNKMRKISFSSLKKMRYVDINNQKNFQKASRIGLQPYFYKYLVINRNSTITHDNIYYVNI